MYLLKISKAWNDDGEIGLTVEQEILFSTEKKANDHLLNVSKNKGRCITIVKYFIDSEKRPEVIRDEWWCE